MIPTIPIRAVCSDRYYIDTDETIVHSPTPQYQTEFSSGMDLHSEPFRVFLAPYEKILINTGLKLAIPPGYEGQIRTRSSMAWKKGLIVLNSPGTIDSDYRGEIKVILYNSSNENQTVERFERIAQLVISPVVHANFCLVTADKLSETARGDGGFGSTGT